MAMDQGDGAGDMAQAVGPVLVEQRHLGAKGGLGPGLGEEQLLDTGVKGCRDLGISHGPSIGRDARHNSMQITVDTMAGDDAAHAAHQERQHLRAVAGTGPREPGHRDQAAILGIVQDRKARADGKDGAHPVRRSLGQHQRNADVVARGDHDRGWKAKLAHHVLQVGNRKLQGVAAGRGGIAAAIACAEGHQHPQAASGKIRLGGTRQPPS